ncbi:MAG: hypothetical protein M3Q65_02565 [Chloroflexota bacterium]|nr:hypothetical protein [Chloroflexota bacterium]
MKAPIPLPFVRRGENVPPTGVTMQAVLGFLLPFLLIALTALITYFIIRAGIERPAPAEEETSRLLLQLFA